MIQSTSSPATRLGFVSLVCLVIGNMIGSGIYVSSGYSLSDLKDAKYVMLVWLIAGVHAMCGAVAYAAVAARLPVSGGEYAILSRWVHPRIGFLAGWISLVAGFAAPIAASAKLFAFYLLPNAEQYAWYWLTGLATGSILVAAILHWVEVRFSAWFNNGVIVAKFVCLGVFLAIGLTVVLQSGHSGIVEPVIPSSQSLLVNPSEAVAQIEGTLSPEPAETTTSSGMLPSVLLWGMVGSLFYTTLSYTGFNASIYMAGEYKDEPQSLGSNRSDASTESARVSWVVPRSMVVACAVVTVVYLLLNVVFLYAIPANEVVQSGERFVSTVAMAIGGEWCRAMMQWAIILSSATSILAMMMTGPHVFRQMAVDYHLVSETGNKQRQIRVAIIVQVIVACAVVWLSSLRSILTYLGLTLTACGALAIASLWITTVMERIRYRNQEEKQIRRSIVSTVTWWEHLCAVMYVCGAVFLLIVAFWKEPIQFWCCLATFLSGLLVHSSIAVYQHRKSR